MRGNLRKGLLIAITAVSTGAFFQLTSFKESVSENKYYFKPSIPPFLADSTSSWADSALKSLSSAHKIGQLLMVSSNPEKGKPDADKVVELIKKFHVGGVIFFKGTPEQVSSLTSLFQSVSVTPLLFSIDAEWGLSMRLSNTIKYPRQMMLGAITDDDVIYDMGRDIAIQLKMIGIHVNFAPDIDVNNNPDNPVINSRSFGEIRENVSRKGNFYTQGLQDQHIIAVAKHFPGHGDTDVDSHLKLPVIKHSMNRLDSIELFPFRALIENGVSGVMIAHMNVLSIDSTPDLPSTFSSLIVDSLLKSQMKFKGLVITDAMNMKGVLPEKYSPEEAVSKAILAGNDIILMPDNIENAIHNVEKMIKSGKISQDDIDARCRKILQAKFWAEHHMSKNKLPLKILSDSLNSDHFELTRRKLIERAITVIDNKDSIIPFLRLDTCKFAAISIGGSVNNYYQQTLTKYTQVDLFHLSGDEDATTQKMILDKLKLYNIIFLSMHSDEMREQHQFGINDKMLSLVDTVLSSYPVIFNAFVNPYVLKKLNNLGKSRAFIVSYENDTTTQSLSAQVMFGGIGASGRLPISINSYYKAGMGVSTKGGIRFKYTIPLEGGFNEKKLTVIDTIIDNAIKKEAMPGCQVLIARYGKVIYEKSYGYQTYHKERPVQNDDLYDLASITKIASTLPSIMLLDQNKKIDVSQPLSKYLPESKNTNKGKLIISDILLHQAGLQSWIPFYVSTLEPVYPNQAYYSTHFSTDFPIQLNKKYFINKHLRYKDGYYSHTRSDVFSVEVADNFFMNHNFIDSIYKSIYNSDVSPPGKYLYSDLGFYLFRKMIENFSGQKFENYVDSVFYKQLGATTLGFKPLERFSIDRIVPTENDLVFRRQIIHGYVHDPGAAMLGGVSGHAGLFACANDLGKYMQMILNGGEYGGHRFISSEIIRKYTSVYSSNGNRRGLGFDKPQKDVAEIGPTMKGISPESFGHTGFTGTIVWADPSTGILYIFLSNRVYPDSFNNKLIDMNVRTNVQKSIYDALIQPMKK